MLIDLSGLVLEDCNIVCSSSVWLRKFQADLHPLQSRQRSQGKFSPGLPMGKSMIHELTHFWAAVIGKETRPGIFFNLSCLVILMTVKFNCCVKK